MLTNQVFVSPAINSHQVVYFSHKSTKKGKRVREEDSQDPCSIARKEAKERLKANIAENFKLMREEMSKKEEKIAEDVEKYMNAMESNYSKEYPDLFDNEKFYAHLTLDWVVPSFPIKWVFIHLSKDSQKTIVRQVQNYSPYMRPCFEIETFDMFGVRADYKQGDAFVAEVRCGKNRKSKLLEKLTVHPTSEGQYIIQTSGFQSSGTWLHVIQDNSSFVGKPLEITFTPSPLRWLRKIAIKLPAHVVSIKDFVILVHLWRKKLLFRVWRWLTTKQDMVKVTSLSIQSKLLKIMDVTSRENQLIISGEGETNGNIISMVCYLIWDCVRSSIHLMKETFMEHGFLAVLGNGSVNTLHQGQQTLNSRLHSSTVRLPARHMEPQSIKVRFDDNYLSLMIGNRLFQKILQPESNWKEIKMKSKKNMMVLSSIERGYGSVMIDNEIFSLRPESCSYRLPDFIKERSKHHWIDGVKTVNGFVMISNQSKSEGYLEVLKV
jgi:hypothetical protein